MPLYPAKKIELIENRIKSIENRLGNINYEMKGVVKSELTASSVILEQSQMQFGMYTGLCIETTDVWKQNRVRWYSPIFHNPKRPIKEFPWANPISSMGGFDDCGLTWVPPAGSKLCIIFENGNREAAYYLGTTWDRNRGSAGERRWGINVEEFNRVSAGSRGGYLVGPNDESQVFPPWNTENYNGFDLTSIVDFAENPEAQKLITYPHIYGFKTPEKHAIKMVDGDPKCNRKWKRFEIMSSCGNWIMLKDDHLHYAGQWAHPDCGGKVTPGETSCVKGASNQSQQDLLRQGITNFRVATSSEESQYTLNTGEKKEDTYCDGRNSNKKIIGGHPSTGHPNSKYVNTQIGSNPFFKHRQECRPYRGSSTPQNSSVDLPQSGIQIMSISGHTFVMDDSVQEPSGDPKWDREFDFGCNNIYQGRTYWQSATGHRIEMSDVELNENPTIRNEDNYIRILSASGNKIELNDHTLPGCKAGEKRGIFLQSTSNHVIQMVDDTNKQCSPPRREGGVPNPSSNKAFVKIRTGYGLEMSFNDDYDQKSMDKQYIQIFCPRKGGDGGPHIHRYQEADPGLIFLRSGGYHIKSTYKDDISIIGDEEPANKIEIITKTKLVYSKDYYVNVTDKSHVFLAKQVILLLAGSDCPSPGGEAGGCAAPVVVYQGGCLRISDRVIASCSPNAPPANLFMLKPFAKCE